MCAPYDNNLLVMLLGTSNERKNILAVETSLNLASVFPLILHMLSCLTL